MTADDRLIKNYSKSDWELATNDHASAPGICTCVYLVKATLKQEPSLINSCTLARLKSIVAVATIQAYTHKAMGNILAICYAHTLCFWTILLIYYYAWDWIWENLPYMCMTFFLRNQHTN